MADATNPASETETQLAQSVRELEDIRYALDQSAIVATTDVTGRIKSVNDKSVSYTHLTLPTKRIV